MPASPHRRPHRHPLVGHGAHEHAEDPGDHVGRVGDPAPHRVRQAQLVAEDPAQAVGEARAAAEDVVEDRQGVEVRVIAGDAQVPEPLIESPSRMLSSLPGRS